MKYYGGVRGALQSVVIERRNYPGAAIRIRCTCGWSEDFDKVHKARMFLVLHYAHISNWSIDLVDTDGAIVWRLESRLVAAK